jgi:hypothetical protein
MADAGLVFVCVGCCCGRAGHGGALAAPAPAGTHKRAVRRAHGAAALSGRVRLAFMECLGPELRAPSPTPSLRDPRSRDV